MRRPLLIVPSAILLGAMTVAAFGGGAGDRIPAAPSFLSVGTSATAAAAETGESVPSRDPSEPDERSVLFDRLWVGIVGVVVLLLVVRMVRLEAAWRRQPGVRPKSRNESRSRDVLTDE